MLFLYYVFYLLQQTKEKRKATFSKAKKLVIPSNPRQWALKQKSLVNGGLYFVHTPDNIKKYSVWNGSSFVPSELL